MGKNSKPIGVFDSGLGGLTVVRQLRKLLPGENLIYLGDTARVPYGNKSRATIQRFSSEDTRFLLRKGVKMVVVACNTSTALALPHLKARFRAPVVGVVRPGAEAAVRATRNGRIGVIATSGTISSGAYESEIKKLMPRAKVFSVATPLLVPLVEEGWGNNRLTRDIIRHYLKPLLKNRIDTLILGCTHYPLLKSAIRQAAGPRLHLVDSAHNCAVAVRKFLKSNSARRGGKLAIYVTDRPESFSKSARLFLGRKAPLAKLVKL